MLCQIQTRIEDRVAAIRAAHPDWPCQKGCDDCCRSLASEPQITQAEWLLLEPALTDALKDRIAAAANAPRPVVCPLLDADSGSCLVYGSRPIACRTYGYYAERDKVLGCFRIESLAAARDAVLWGNHSAIEQDAEDLGPVRPLSYWLTAAFL